MRRALPTHERLGRLGAEVRFLLCAALGVGLGTGALRALENVGRAAGEAQLVASAHAQSAPPPVELAVDSIFGHDALLPGGYTTLVVRATNRTASALQGEVTVETRTWERIVSVHRAPLDLPAREGRYTTLTVPAFEDGLSLNVVYRAGGSELASTSSSLGYSGSARPIVVLDDPPRLRAPLVGTTVSIADPYGSTRDAQIPIGVATTDVRSGDLLLPDTAAGWSNVLLAIATVPALGRADEPELVALERWIHVGGHAVIMPTRDADLDHPFLRRTAGTLRRGDADPASVAALLGSPDAPIACPPGATPEVFGCQVRLGFGVLWITDLDLSAASSVNRPETQEILRAIARAVASGQDRARPFLSFAQGLDRPVEPWMTGSSVASVRSALDPNEGYRPALVLVGIVLMAYVILVGPVNFTLVERRKQPTLALLTTPLLAFLCVLATFLVGYVGKGVLMRYRRIELLDAADGASVASARRYTGLFYTRPAAVDVELPAGAVAMRIGGGGGDGPVNVEGSEHASLRSMRAGLWETAFTREDEAMPLGGAVSFELDGTRIARVRNDSPLVLRAAFMTDLAGGVYSLGEIPAGAAVEVPTAPSSYIAVGERPDPQYWNSADAFLGTLGYQTDARDAVLALLSLGSEAPSSGSLPVLYARLDPSDPPAATPEFTRELDLRILRVVPRMPGAPTYVPNLPVSAGPSPVIGIGSSNGAGGLTGETGMMNGLPESGGAP